MGGFCYARYMAQTFFFYDLETSGLRAADDRIMQFAGQRTDMDLNPIGEPINELVKLNDDTLPSPDALMVTGISPQQTVADGYSEAEFAEILSDKVFTKDTIAVGFNNIRFDDEFIRHLFWRNFHDPYTWSYEDGRSRWDLLDVVRMTRALRPEGIEWPVDKDGKPTNRLELLTKINGIDHFKAHDAMSDVEALISVTGLIKTRQPQLFDYLLKMRDKNEVKRLVNLDIKTPFVYTEGRIASEYEKTTVAFPLTSGQYDGVIAYDLRFDPTPFLDMDPSQLRSIMYASKDQREKSEHKQLSVFEIQANRAPAVAPLGVLEQHNGWAKIKLDKKTIEGNKAKLLSAPHFAENLRTMFEDRPAFAKQTSPEARLYDGFVGSRDKSRIQAVRRIDTDKLADFNPEFDDERLHGLLLHYKARNYPDTLSESEMIEWERWRTDRIKGQLPQVVNAIKRLSSTDVGTEKQFLLQEIQLWIESTVSVEDLE